MSSTVIGNVPLSQLAEAGIDTATLLSYFHFQQAQIAQEVVQSQVTAIQQLQQQLANSLNMGQAVDPILAEAAKLDQQVTWTVDRGDTEALQSSQQTTQTAAQNAESAADSLPASASAVAQLVKDAADAAEAASQTQSPGAAQAAASLAQDKAEQAESAAKSAKTSATSALESANEAKQKAEDAFDSADLALQEKKALLAQAKEALEEAATDEEKETAKAAVADAETAVTKAENAVKSAEQSIVSADQAIAKATEQGKVADAALVAAGQAMKAAEAAAATAAILAEPKVIQLDGGYQLLLGPEAGHFQVQGKDGMRLDVTGDGQVTSTGHPEMDWTIAHGSTFVLPDGTKLTLDMQGGKADGLTITKGNQLLTVAGMLDDTPVISEATTGGRALDAAHNDGHVFTLTEGAWKHQGQPITPGAALATSFLVNEVVVETNDLPLPENLIAFLQAQGITIPDSDGDGRLNAPELEQLAGLLDNFTQELSAASANALATLRAGAQALLDFSAALQEVIERQEEQSEKMQQAAQEMQRQAQELQRRLQQERTLEDRAQVLLDAMKDSLLEVQKTDELTARLLDQPAADLAPGDRANVESKLAEWKESFEKELADLQQGLPKLNEPQNQTFFQRPLKWV